MRTLFGRYESEQAYVNGEKELGFIQTGVLFERREVECWNIENIVNVMTSDSYPEKVPNKNEIHIVRMENGKQDTRELRHPDETEGWKEIRLWVSVFK